MRRFGRRQLLWSAVGMALSMVVVMLSRRFLSPINFLPDDRIWVFVSSGCPYSVDISTQIKESPSVLWPHFLLVPADNSTTGMPGALAICMTTLQQIDWDAHFLAKVLPDSLACRWLVDDAAAMYRELSIEWPNYYFGQHILTGTEFTSVLHERGLAFDHQTNTLFRAGQPIPDHRRRLLDRAEEPRPETVWDDLVGPHVVGW